MKNLNLLWFKEKFFSTPLNSFLTISIIYLGFITIPPLANWIFFDATFIGSKKSDCVSGGACWVFVNVWFERFIYGLYPAEEIWRINLAFGILAANILVYNFVGSKSTDVFFDATIRFCAVLHEGNSSPRNQNPVNI